jgi:ribosomal protein L12E/L44/L45/RPP1/RPP2
MRYVAAALLSALGGSAINEAGIKLILDSVGIEYDAEKAKKVDYPFVQLIIGVFRYTICIV